MSEPKEPELPPFKLRQRVNVNLLGGKRYAIDISTRSFPVKPTPGEVIEMPKRPDRSELPDQSE